MIGHLRQRYVRGDALTTNEIGTLFRIIDDLHHTQSSLIAVIPADHYAAVITGYSHILDALARAGLDLEQASGGDGSYVPWVWFYCWQGGHKQGPFGTLDTALTAAVLQLRSGVFLHTS
jgi:hypothetical protein